MVHLFLVCQRAMREERASVKGDIVLRRGIYIEMIIEEVGSTRLIVCFNFRQADPQPIDVQSYRIEYWDEGQIKHQTAEDLEHARATFGILTEQYDPRVKDRLVCLRLAERVQRHLCINCGTDKEVTRALCTECRKLPRFQEVLDMPDQEGV